MRATTRSFVERMRAASRRRTLRVSCVAFLGAALSMSTSAFAENFYAVRVLPANPIPGELVFVRVAAIDGPDCLPPAVLTTQGSTTRLALYYSDTCATGTPVAYRDYALGPYDRGRHRLIIDACIENPPPLPNNCTTRYQGTIAVGVVPASVPALSLWSGSLLTLALFATSARLFYSSCAGSWPPSGSSRKPSPAGSTSSS